MKIELFKNKVKDSILEFHFTDQSLSFLSMLYLKYFENIFSENEIDVCLKMTRMTIIFEGFYRSIPENCLFKTELQIIRLERWKLHFGTPTLDFLITYYEAIEKTKKIFCTTTPPLDQPWNVGKTSNLSIDFPNNILSDEKSSLSIPLPLQEEKKGELLKTYNETGGFTTTSSDPVSESFIQYTNQKKGSIVLEIGAAFGAATLKALENEAVVYCNDIDSRNLAVIKNRYLNILKKSTKKITEKNLIPLPASFPDELLLPKNFFDAILICRVLHFLSGEKIIQALRQLFQCLKPGGKLFIVCETPYLKNWKKFIPEYHKKESEGKEWPGEINTPENYENSGFSTSLPRFVHWISKDVLKNSLLKSNFTIDYLSYIDRKGQFPPELLLDGKESIGSISIKPL